MIRSTAIGHGHHATEGEEQQHVVLSTLDPQAFQVAMCQANAGDPAYQEKDIEVTGKTIVAQHAIERRVSTPVGCRIVNPSAMTRLRRVSNAVIHFF